MPIARVQLPDGRIARVEVPEGTTPEQATAFARQAAGKQPKPAPQKSAWQHARDIGENALAGAATAVGSIPDALIEGTGAVMRTGLKAGAAPISAFARYAGVNNVADTIDRGVGMADRAWAKPATIRRAVDQYAPVKPGYETSRLVTELGVGAMIPFGPKGVPQARIPQGNAAGTARQVVRDAAANKTRVFTSDLKPPRTVIGKSARKLGELIPIAGTSSGRVKQQAERIEAVKAFVREFDMPETVINDVGKSLTATRASAISQLSARKAAVIDGTQGIAPPTKTLDALDAKIAELTARGTATAREVAAKLQDMRPDFEGKTVAQLEAMRADELSGAFKGDSLAHIKDLGEKSLRAIYNPLRQDMGDHIKATGGQDAFRTWRVANARLSGMMEELNSSALKSVLNKVVSTPEDVGKLLFSTKPSQIRLLYNNLSAAGRTKAQAAIIQRALQKASDDAGDIISPDKFANEIDRLGKSVGVFFQQGDKARIEGLSRLLAYTKRAAQAGVMPDNGAQVVPWAIPAALTQMFGLEGGIGVAALAGTAARIYESPAARDAILKLGRTTAGTAQEAKQMTRLVSAIAPIVERARSAINDNMAGAAAQLPGRVAAEEQVSDSGGAPPQP